LIDARSESTSLLIGTDVAESFIRCQDQPGAPDPEPRTEGRVATSAREKAGIQKPTLSQEIEDLLNSGQLPSWLGENAGGVHGRGARRL
jgi:hypothetical protein